MSVGARQILGMYTAGNGSQWPRMGRELLQTNATFRKSIEICAKALEPYNIDLIAAYESEDGFGDARTAATGLASIQVHLLDLAAKFLL